MSLSWCAELMLNPVVRWRAKRRSATHPNLDALTRGLKPHGYLQETAPRSSKTSKLQSWGFAWASPQAGVKDSLGVPGDSGASYKRLELF